MLTHIGFWGTVGLAVIVFFCFFALTVYANYRKDRKEEAVIRVKEEQIAHLADELKYYKKMLLIKDGYSEEEADKIIYRD